MNKKGILKISDDIKKDNMLFKVRHYSLLFSMIDTCFQIPKMMKYQRSKIVNTNSAQTLKQWRMVT